MRVIEFLSEIGPLSPEGRYLFLAIIFERMNGREKRIDVSVSRLRDSFGVSHKVVSELLEYLQSRRVGEVIKVRHGKHEFTFDSVYIDSLTEEGELSVHEAFVEVFSPEVKTALKAKELKLRPSNLLLIGIFILHANELGFIQSSATGSEELLSEGKIRRLMGGINQSRLKSQLATLRSIGFIRCEAGGGVCPIYFGKFGKRYQIDLGFLSPRKNTRNALFVDEILKNVSDFIYETPECYLVYRVGKECSLKYEFDFELPFKLSFLIGKKLWLKPRHKMLGANQSQKECVDNFNLRQLELDPFLRLHRLTLGILVKLELLTALILVKYWQSLTMDKFEKLEQLLESDSELQQRVQKGSIFTQKYLHAQNDLEWLEDTHCFWKSCLISLSLGLAMSLAKVIRGHCGHDAKLKTISLLIHDFQHYSPTKGKYPSCDISASYSTDDTVYDLNIVGSKYYISESLARRRVIGVDLDNIMIKEHTTYSIWMKSST
ncbi:hypothetical protein ND920_17945 [Vibrio ordalii]|uniref:hypothetical protein n=1 Tax=Vibrio ordalii TaxID=28174 RepID=UPI00257883B6|nr:hypothetical protein [Vibrio ordalii]